VSPVFPTESHLNETALGISRFQKLAQKAQIPIYALGGINNKNALQLINSPAIGIAGISAIS
jgi:thiamine monophosphate synthase